MSGLKPVVPFAPAINLRAAVKRLAKEKSHDAALAIQKATAALKTFREENLKVVP